MNYIQLDLDGNCAHLRYRVNSYLSGYSQKYCIDCKADFEHSCKNAINMTYHGFLSHINTSF